MYSDLEKKNIRLVEYIKIVFYNIIFTYKIHIKWLPKKNAILENILMPVLQGLFYVLVANYMDSENIIYYIIGTLCFTAVNSNIDGVATLISSERRFGTLNTTITSVYNPIFIFLGRLLYWCIIGYIRFISTFTVLFFIFLKDKISLKIFIEFSIIYILICLALSGIGYMIGILGMAKRNIMGLSNVISSVLLLVSGVYFSKDILPKFISWIGYISPLYYGIEICRSVILNGIYENILGKILIMISLGTLYMIVGIICFNKIEKKILTDNQIESF